MKEMALRSRMAVLVGAAALAALLMALATPAQAQQTLNERFPIDATSENVCTGEPFYFEGTVHALGKVFEDESGGSHFIAHGNLQGRGESPSGAKYVLNSASTTSSKYDSESAQTFTFAAHFNHIRQGEDGTEEDLKGLLVIHLTQNANGEYTAEVSNIEFECH